MPGGLYARLAELPLELEAWALEPLAQTVTGGWTRRTTVIRLSGGGHDGVGEDVTYEERDQLALQAAGLQLERGRTTLHGFSRALDRLDAFPSPPMNPASRLYRRWALESAALDLALRQAERSLAEALGRAPAPVEFVVSLGLGEPASLAPVRERLARYPRLAFKLDPTPDWSDALIAELAATDTVRTLDLKGQYRGPYTGTPPVPALYARLAAAFPAAWLEDPALAPETEAALAPAADRVTWDAPLHSLADVLLLTRAPRAVNIKPSRFGLLSELLRVYEHCEARGVAMYGGGQFELGPGRGQIQYLASLFHPAAPNDVAPREFNLHPLPNGLPSSPLAPAPTPSGFRWGQD